MKYLVFCIWLFFPGILFAITVTDDDGQVLQFSQPAKRVISLAPDITEILYAIDANNTIVGVMAGSDYPAAARKLPVIGSYSGLDLERILQIHPDLIITWGNNFSKQLAILKKYGIPIYVNHPTQLQDVAHAMENFGSLVGKQNIAIKAANQYREKLKSLTSTYQAQQKVTVFYQIGDSLLTINKDSWINQVISACGGRNIFAKANLTVPEIDMEAVIAANPQVILSSNHNDAWQSRWQKWQRVNAVRKGNLYTLHPDLIERAGPRLVDGVAQVCQFLQKSRTKV